MSVLVALVVFRHKAEEAAPVAARRIRGETTDEAETHGEKKTTDPEIESETVSARTTETTIDVGGGGRSGGSASSDARYYETPTTNYEYATWVAPWKGLRDGTENSEKEGQKGECNGFDASRLSIFSCKDSNPQLCGMGTNKDNQSKTGAAPNAKQLIVLGRGLHGSATAFPRRILCLFTCVWY